MNKSKAETKLLQEEQSDVATARANLDQRLKDVEATEQEACNA